MEVVYPRCCGLDVHKKTVVACRILLWDHDRGPLGSGRLAGRGGSDAGSDGEHRGLLEAGVEPLGEQL